MSTKLKIFAAAIAATFIMSAHGASAASFNIDYSYDGENVIISGEGTFDLSQAINTPRSSSFEAKESDNRTYSARGYFNSYAVGNGYKEFSKYYLPKTAGDKSQNISFAAGAVPDGTNHILDINMLASPDYVFFDISPDYKSGERFTFRQVLIPYTGRTAKFMFDTIALTGNEGLTFANNTVTFSKTDLTAVSVSEVPLPAALPLLATSLAGLGFAARRRKS